MIIENSERDEKEMLIKQKLINILTRSIYTNIINEIIENYEEINTFTIDLDDMRTQDKELYVELLNRPTKIIKIIEETLKEIISESEENEMNIPEFRISFKGSVGKNTVSPRGLKANLVNKLIKLEGVVTYLSKSRVRLLKSSHFCEQTNKYTYKEYNDNLSLKQDLENNNRSTNIIPIYDEQSNPLSFEYGLSKFKDFQILCVQENPENVPTGLLSRGVEVFLQEDLVDTTKPGDRVQIIGVLKPITNSQTFKNGIFKKTILGFNVKSITDERRNQTISHHDIQNFKKVSNRKDIIDIFIRSLAPSIFGHNYIKEALLLMLFGGNEITLENNTRIRGDLNILLIGDPSTGKSQFLRKIMSIAPLSFSTTGRGSTGVGLTAAVTFDKDTKEKRLEAGAMVLADRGIICIDEFDKMSPEDRVSMHEVMEQQTVTIAKAGIHLSLNARCGLLAAANPVYGEYMTNKSPSFNIGMRDTLLSRFDLIFIVLDENSVKIDKMIARRVTRNHRFFNGKNLGINKDGTGIIEEELIESTSSKNSSPYQQYNVLFHDDKKTQYLTENFIQKYICYAKNTLIKPELTEESSDYISEKWALIRKIENEKEKLTKIMPITIRSLESLIRMSTAYAKMRLSKKVEKRDCVQAFRIFLNAFYGNFECIDPAFFREEKNLLKLGRKGKKKQVKTKKESGSSSKKNTKKKRKLDKMYKIKEETMSKISNEKLKDLYKIIYDLRKNKNKNTRSESSVEVQVKEVWKFIEEDCPNSSYPEAFFKDKNELYFYLEDLDNKRKIMLHEDKIYII